MHLQRQPHAVGGAGQVSGRIVRGKRAALGGQRGRCGKRMLAHRQRDAARTCARLDAVVAQPQHRQRVARARHAHPDAPRPMRFACMGGERPRGQVEHIVEQANLDVHRVGQRREIEARLAVDAERMVHEPRQVDRPQHAAAVGRQRLLAARVRRVDPFVLAQRFASRIVSRNSSPGSALSRAALTIACHTLRAGTVA